MTSRWYETAIDDRTRLWISHNHRDKRLLNVHLIRDYDVLMQSSNQKINKPLVGMIALGCLVAAGVLHVWFPDQQLLESGFWRVGLLMVALWLALPRKGENIAWEKALPLVLGAIILIAVSKRALIVVLPLVIVVAIAAVFIRPRPKHRHGPPPPTKR